MEEIKDLMGNEKPEESSDYFSDGEGKGVAAGEGALSDVPGEGIGAAPDAEAAEPVLSPEEAPAADGSSLMESEGKDTADPADSSVQEEAPGAVQEEVNPSAEREAWEEARRAAQQKAEDEARLAAEMAAQEQARLNAERKAQAQAQKAEEKKVRDEQKAAQKAARKEARKARREAMKNWVPGPNFPNQLTIARICMIPLFVVLILWVPKPVGNILSMIVFIIASLTDTADGYIARKYNYVSTFGKFMDPLADKLLVCSALICLVDLGRIESWIVIIIIAREFIISGFRLVAVEKGVVIAANIWGKVKTVMQMLMVILMLGNFSGFLGTVAQILKWAALVLTLISLATYLFQNRHVLKDETAESPQN